MATTAVVAGTATAVSGAVAGHQRAKAQAQQQEAMAEQAAMQTQAEVAAMQQQLDAMQAQQMQTQMQVQPAAAAQAPPAGDDMTVKLQELAKLKEQGILTDEEFAAAKAKLLAG
jgi:hypothetical protein